MPSANSLAKDNPFTIVYRTCLDLARNNIVLGEYISKGNIIDYSDSLDPKTEISDSDLPELTLTTNTITGILRESSSTARVVKNYSWILITGDYRLSVVYDQIMWELFQLMIDWDRFICMNATWKNQSFVKEVRGLTGTEGTSFVAEEDRNAIRGWSSIWPFEVDMHFLVSDLRKVLDGERIVGNKLY